MAVSFVKALPLYSSSRFVPAWVPIRCYLCSAIGFGVWTWKMVD
uniref:Uncharacterized protein n=1 Tax=Arundo donax TaxID=35708 RepID=A0A0A9FYF3_ARUDO